MTSDKFIIFNNNLPEFIYNYRNEAYTVLSKLVHMEKNIYQHDNFKSSYRILHIVHSLNGVCLETYNIIYDINKGYIIKNELEKKELNNISAVPQVNDEKTCVISTKRNVDTIDNLTNQLKTIINDIDNNSISSSISSIYKDVILDNETDNINNRENYELIDNTSNTDTESETNTLNDTEHQILEKLFKDRNRLNEDIKTQEIIVNNASKLLNDELFEQRCKEQEEKRKLEKYKEKISIFEADKNTFLQINSKIRNNILNTNNIPILFKQKYLIIKFLDINELVSFTDNSDINIEYSFYEQLYDIVENHDSDDGDIIDKIDSDMIPLYESFIVYLTENENLIISEEHFNDMLNNDNVLKERLFGKKTENDIFKNDIDKNTFMQ